MSILRLLTVIGLLGACLALAACGDDDAATEDAQTTTAPPVQTATVAPEDTATPAKTPKPPKPAKTPKGNATPAGTQKVAPGLPSTTPEPGPPVKFRIAITDGAITPNTETVPEGKSFKVFVDNDTDKTVTYELISHGNVVGAGQIIKRDKTFVLVRNLLPGKLIAQSGKRRSVIRVVSG